MSVQELLDDGLLEPFHRNLVELNMDSAEELQSYVTKLQLAVEQGRLRLLGGDGAEGRAEVGPGPRLGDQNSPRNGPGSPEATGKRCDRLQFVHD